jgi:hypothetical protein
MADTGARFSKSQVTKLRKSGALDFIAGVTGATGPDEIKWIATKSGAVKLGATYTVEGRTTIKAAVKGLSVKEFEAATSAGYIEVLAKALGHHDAKGKPSTKVIERARR